MRENWVKCDFNILIENISTANYKIKQKDYMFNGTIPVVDQGQELIGGYYNQNENIIPVALPVIVFGDHTKCLKFINFNFIPGADGTKVLQVNKYILDKFIYYILKVLIFKIQDKGYARHFQFLQKEKIPLPPLPEQRAIVKKIETLFSSLDAGVDDLKKAQEQLKVYRQAVLKKAFEGEYHSYKIKEVCHNIKVGIVIKPTQFYSNDNSGIKAFRSANVREFKVEDNNWVYFTEEGNEINNRTKLQLDDVLIVRSGYPGTSCIVTEKYVNCNAIDIIIATPNQELLSSKFLCLFNNSPLGKGLFSKESRGVAQKHLNVGVYGDLHIPLPSLEDQSQIVKEIEARLSVCDAVEKQIVDSLIQAEALRQSILKKAFEGTLLTIDEIEACKLEPDYESASVLLEKIKTEKAANKPVRKTTKNKTLI